MPTIRRRRSTEIVALRKRLSTAVNAMGLDSDAIETLKQTLRAPVSLPTPEVLSGRARDLEKVLAADPLRAREALRAIFENGKIIVHPSAHGSYVAEGTFLPLVAIADPSPCPKRGATARQWCSRREPTVHVVDHECLGGRAPTPEPQVIDVHAAPVAVPKDPLEAQLDGLLGRPDTNKVLAVPTGVRGRRTH